MTAQKRRPKADGAVYKTADGWRGVVDLGWSGAKRKRKYVRGRTQREVLTKMRPLVEAARSGSLRTTRSPRLDEWMATYLDEVAASKVRPSTLSRYRQEVRLYISPALGRIPLQQIDPQHIAKFYREQLQHLSPGSVRRLHALLRRSFTVAVRWGLVTSNPVILVDPPSPQQQPVDWLRLHEVRRLLNAAAQTPLHARWLLAATLGPRQGEALGLLWDDIDFVRRQIHVRRALQRRSDGALVLVELKTARSRRTIPMSPRTVRTLAKHRRRQDAARMAAGDEWHEHGLVFTTRTGGPISPRNDHRAFQRLLTRAGLRRVRLHDLRHTAASLMLQLGVHPRVVMEILGHSQISLTMNTYSHVVPESVRQATDTVEEALWNEESLWDTD